MAHIDTAPMLPEPTGPRIPTTGKAQPPYQFCYPIGSSVVSEAFLDLPQFPLFMMSFSTNSPLMHAASSLVLNAVKHLAGIPDAIHLLSPTTIAAVAPLKQNVLSSRTISLDLEETRIARPVGAATNPTAQLAMEKLKALAGCEVHMTHLPTRGDEAGLRKLGVNLTTEPVMPSRNLLDG